MNESDFKTLFGRAPDNSKNPMVFIGDEDFAQMAALVDYYRRISNTKKCKAAFNKTNRSLDDLEGNDTGVALQTAFVLAENADKGKNQALLARVERGLWQDPCATVRKGETYADFATLAKAFCASAREQLWAMWTSVGVHGFVVYQNMMIGAAGSGEVVAVRFGPDCEAKTLEALLLKPRIGDVPSRFKEQAGHLAKTPEQMELCRRLSENR